MLQNLLKIMKIPRNEKLFSLILFLLLCPYSTAEGMESDWLEPIEGFQGERLDALVTEVTQNPNSTIIEMSIPLLKPPESVDPTVVIKKPGENKIITVIRNPEFIDSEDPGSLGLRFKVQGISKFHFKIQLMEDSIDQREKSP